LYRLYYRLIPGNIAVYEKVQRFWISKAIAVACELNIADIIGDDAETIDEIAKMCNADPESLYRLLRALASDGIFKETGKRIFVNTPQSDGLREGAGSMKYMIQHQMGDNNMQMLAGMKYSVTTGKSMAMKLFGTDVFTHLKNNPDKNELYNKAMTDGSNLFSDVFVASYSFKGDETIIDVGGGEGLLVARILLNYPKINGVVFDLPHVVKAAVETFERFGVSGRAEIEQGDIFGSIPADGDIYILKNILHIFDDEACVRILMNIKSAMHGKSKILIIETVVGDDNSPGFGKVFDLQMLIGTEGGKERTANEYEMIFNRAGLRTSRIIETVSPMSIIEVVPE